MITSPITIRQLAVVTGLALIAACKTAEVPPPPPPLPPPPPPPVVQATPYRPLPPPQAAYAMDIPPRDASGKRLTVNTGLNENQTLWHFRSGWNVAALNCTRPQDEPVTAGYGTFLSANARALTAANTALDADFRRSAGSARAGLLAREQYMTMVYNYFASPPARGAFCDAALAVANEMAATPPANLGAFATSGLARYEQAFEQFYTAYEAYQTASADWDRRYGAQFGASQPGWVAVHGNAAAQVANGLVELDLPTTVAVVTDPVTGAAIPVVPVTEGIANTPVVQPVPNAATPPR